VVSVQTAGAEQEASAVDSLPEAPHMRGMLAMREAQQFYSYHSAIESPQVIYRHYRHSMSNLNSAVLSYTCNNGSGEYGGDGSRKSGQLVEEIYLLLSSRRRLGTDPEAEEAHLKDALRGMMVIWAHHNIRMCICLAFHHPRA
jgi:hypothetical protein